MMNKFNIELSPLKIQFSLYYTFDKLHSNGQDFPC